MLFYEDRRLFATGMMEYEYRPVSQQGANVRLILRVELDDLSFLAVVDTGAPYVIVAPAFARLLQLDSADALERTELIIRGVNFPGYIHRLPLQLPASRGESFRFEATTFIPEVDENDWGNLPSFLGMFGCLERIRFAIDPAEDAFYFGALP